MRLKQVLVILSLNIFLLSSMLLVVLPANSQGAGLGGGAVGNTESNFTLLSDNTIDLLLAGTVVSTKTIETYIPFEEYSEHFAAEITGLPGGTFTWYLQDFPPDTLSDVLYDWTGGSGCTQQPNNNIVCGSGISYFYVEYRYSSPFSPTSSFLTIYAGTFSSGFSPDNTATLNYVEPLEFITSTLYSFATVIEPVLHNNTTLKWQIPNSTNGGIAAIFYDPRINIVYLPLVIK